MCNSEYSVCYNPFQQQQKSFLPGNDSLMNDFILLFVISNNSVLYLSTNILKKTVILSFEFSKQYKIPYKTKIF